MGAIYTASNFYCFEFYLLDNGFAKIKFSLCIVRENHRYDLLQSPDKLLLLLPNPLIQYSKIRIQDMNNGSLLLKRQLWQFRYVLERF